MKRASMNHVYRLVWSELTRSWVAVSENTAARSKRSSGLAGLVAGMLAVLGIGIAHAAGPLPTGGAIVSGTGSITQSGNRMDVQQSSGKLITNWQSFDIGASNTVEFHQPGASSVALNRVVGGDASQLFGSLKGNGQVWLLNPAGVVIGKGAQIDVGGLVASSLKISDGDFLAGRAAFTDGKGAGAIVNQGDIHATTVALIGPQVTNSGTITTPNGSTVLAAGDKINLDFAGDGLISVNVDSGVLNALVRNEGRISANGGSVTLTVRAADAALSSVINNSGVIEAKSLVARNGRILLDGDGKTSLSGTLDVSSASGKGGDITVTGNTINVSAASLNTSGVTGGGTIKVGGGLHGEDASVANAQSVNVSADVTATADATDTGNGGTVVFWANGSNGFAGNIYVRGGANGGDGGFAEVSGKEALNYTGYTNALAAHGLTGYLMLDPKTIDIYGGSDPGNGASSGWGNVSDTTSGMKIYEKTLEAQAANVALLAVGDEAAGTATQAAKDANGNYTGHTTGLTTTGITFHDLNQNGGDGTITMQHNVSFYAEVVNSSANNAKPKEIKFENPNNSLVVSGTGYIFIESGGANTGTIGETANTNNNTNAQSGGSGVTGRNGTFNLIALGPTQAGDAASVAGAPATLPAHVGTGYLLGQSFPGSTNYNASKSQAPGAGSITVLGADGLSINGNLSTNGGYVRVSGDADSGGVGNLIINKSVTTNGGNFFMSFGSGANNSKATLTYGSVIDLSCTNSATCSSSGHLQTGADITAASGSPSQSMGASTGQVILGGKLVVGGNLDLKNYTINGGASIETDKNSTITLDTGTKLSPNVLDSSGVATSTTGPIGLQAGSIVVNQSGVTGLDSVPLQLKPADAGSNIFVNDTQGVVLGDGTVNRDGSVTGQTTHTTFLSKSDLLYLESLNKQGFIIGRADGTGTIEVGNYDGTPNSFTFNTTGQLGLINGNAIINGKLTNNSGSVFVQAANTANVDQTDKSIGIGNLVITPNGSVTANQDIVLAAEGNFINDRGSDALSAGRRWLVYSTNPSKDVGRNLNVNFKIYEATYKESDGTYTCSGGTCTGTDIASLDDRGQPGLNHAPTTDPIGTRADLIQVLNVTEAGKNGYLYKRQAFIDAQLVGTVTKTYDQNTNTSTGTTLATNPVDSSTGSSLTAANIKLLSNGIDGDNVQLSIDAANIAAAQFDNKNVGTGKTVTASGVKLGVATNGGSGDTVLLDNNNPDATKTVHVYGYRLSSDTVSGNIGTITPKTIGDTLTAGSKTYDGTTAATITGSLSGVLAGDDVTLTKSGAFADKNAGTAKTVNLSSSISGTDADNYNYVRTQTTSADISKKAIGDTLAAGSKTYDGTTAATITGSLSGVLAGDDVTLTKSGAFADKNAGTAKTVNLSSSISGTDADNYNYVRTQTTSADISKKAIGDTLAAGSKTYDGTTAATITGSLSGVLAGDDVTLTKSGAFADKNAGTAKTVNLSSSISGTDADNYNYVRTQTTSADISKKAIGDTLAAGSKTYDGTTAATITGSLSGVLAGDDVTLTKSGAFADKNAGTAKTVNLSSSISGTDADNYNYVRTQTTSADISKKAIGDTLAAGSKTYDGTTAATITGSLSGVLAGDDVTLTKSGAFADKNAGTAKTVNLSSSISGTDADNYNYVRTQTATSDIAKKTITGTATVKDKVYDGDTNAQLNDVTLVGVVAGDAGNVFASGSTGSFDTKNVGASKSVNGSGITLSGTEARNYAFDGTAEVGTAAITPKMLTATAAAADKVYDGTTTAQISNVHLSGVVANDSVAANGGVGEFDSKDAGASKSIHGTGITLSGSDANNYVFDTTAQIATADIKQKVLTAEVAAKNKAFDGNTSVVTESTLVGGLDGDDLAFTATGAFENPLAGKGKTVNVNNVALSGREAGNYTVAYNATTTADITQVAYTPDVLTNKPQGANGTASTAANIGSDVSGGTKGINNSSPQTAGRLYTAAQDGREGRVEGTIGAEVEIRTSLLRNEGRFSLAIAERATVPPEYSTVGVYRNEIKNDVRNEGTYRVADLGSSVEMNGISAGSQKSPDLRIDKVSSGKGLVARADGMQFEVTVVLHKDGTLRIEVPPSAWGLDNEELASGGIALAKRLLGTSVGGIRSVVLQLVA